MRFLVVLLVVCTNVFAQSVEMQQTVLTHRVDVAESGRADRLWKISAMSLAVASALDLHSSYGKCCEANPLLASSDRRFGTKGALIKSFALGGQLGLQSMVRTKSPKLRMIFTIANFGTSVALSFVAAHNYGVPQRSPLALR